MISFIVPTLNEEKYLPMLLRSIKRQKSGGFETIVVDSSSKDRTVEIAKSFGCRTINAPKGVSESRNIGGRAAKGGLLVFVSADVALSDGFFIKKITEKKIRLGIVKMKPDKNTFVNKLVFSAYNFLNCVLARWIPSLAIFPGDLIIVEKRIFEKTGGFNKGMHLSEDRDFVLRASKYAKPVMVDISVFLSTRRMRKWGTMKFFFYHLCSHLYYTFFKKSMPFDYKGVR